MYIPKRKVVCAMITEIDFKVKGEERNKLACADLLVSLRNLYIRSICSKEKSGCVYSVCINKRKISTELFLQLFVFCSRSDCICCKDNMKSWTS